MRVIVVGGAGGMGRVAAWDLARSAGVERVTVADLDGDAAVRVAAETAGSAAVVGGGAEVVGVRGDVTSPELPDLVRGHDVAIASVAYRLNPLVAEACLAAGAHYVDLGGLFHVALKLLDEYGDRFASAGLTGVTCTGGSPGITNLLAVLGARELDRVIAIRVRLAVLDPASADLPLPIPYSLEALLDEFTVPARAWRDGAHVEVPALGEPEEVAFGGAVGTRTAYTTLHSEVATLPRTFRNARDVTFKLALEPELMDKFRLLDAIGLASREPVEIPGTGQVRPRDVLAALGRALPQPATGLDSEIARVELDGERGGRPVTVVAESRIEPDPGTGLGGGQRDTGFPPSIVAQMLARGEVRGPGLFSPEESLDADRFFEELGRRGIEATVRAEPA
jgi:saccharopine dehydrogenase (NAD+, L-lysine-forming)